MDEAGEHSEPAHRRRMQRRERLCSWRYLTFSCYNQLPLLGHPAIRDAFADGLRACREKHRFRLIAWVVMPDHVHMIIVPRVVLGYEDGYALLASNSTVRSILWTLKQPLSLVVLKRWRELRAPILQSIRAADGTEHFWKPGGGFDRNVRSEEKLWKEICYIHDNPVRKGLVERAEDWKWSSARWYAGRKEGEMPIDNGHEGAAWNPPREWVDGAVRIDPREE